MFLVQPVICLPGMHFLLGLPQWRDGGLRVGPGSELEWSGLDSKLSVDSVHYGLQILRHKTYCLLQIMASPSSVLSETWCVCQSLTSILHPSEACDPPKDHSEHPMDAAPRPSLCHTLVSFLAGWLCSEELLAPPPLVLCLLHSRPLIPSLRKAHFFQVRDFMTEDWKLLSNSP